MAKRKSQKSSPPARRAGVPAFVPHLVAAVLVTAALVAVCVVARQYVDQHVAAPSGPLRVVIADRPAWMSDFLASQIQATVPRASSSAFDRDLLISAAHALQHNPWVCHVNQVRRVYGQRPGDTLEINCDFRTPLALVRWGDYFWLVDQDGVKLPEQFTARHVPRIILGRDGRMNIRVIEGVRQPPPETGRTWAGGDVKAGLEMAKLLFGRPCTEQIVTINVENYDGRIDPRAAQVVLRTRQATEVRWGRPPSAEDAIAEVPATQKLEEMAAIVQQYGRVDANQPWVDLRFDKVIYPTPGSVGDADGDAGAASVDAASDGR